MKLREIEVRYKATPASIDKRRIETPDDVFALFRDLQSEAKEKVMCLSLNCKNVVLAFEVVSIGTVKSCLTHPREVFRSAIIQNAASIILVHNHPSGDLSPSRDDVEITKQMQKAGEILGIELADHIIVGDGFVSMRELGVI